MVSTIYKTVNNGLIHVQSRTQWFKPCTKLCTVVKIVYKAVHNSFNLLHGSGQWFKPGPRQCTMV